MPNKNNYGEFCKVKTKEDGDKSREIRFVLSFGIGAFEEKTAQKNLKAKLMIFLKKKKLTNKRKKREAKCKENLEKRNYRP